MAHAQADKSYHKKKQADKSTGRQETENKFSKRFSPASKQKARNYFLDQDRWHDPLLKKTANLTA